MNISSSNLHRRIRRFQDTLTFYQLHGAVITHCQNIFYLSGHLIGEGNGPSLLFIPDKGDSLLLIPEGEQNLPSITRFPGKLLPCSGSNSGLQNASEPAQTLKKYLGKNLKPPLGVEADSLSWDQAKIFEILSEDGAVNIAGEIKKLRTIKDPGEIEFLRNAACVADRGQEEAERVLGEDVGEIHLQALARSAMERLAGCPIECKADVLIGENTALIGSPVGVAGTRRARTGDPAIVDLLPRVNGYFADTTRTLWIGSPSPEQRSVMNLLWEVKGELEKMLRPGVSALEIDGFARTRLTEEGSFPHHTGHGIGISSFEHPFIRDGSDDTLEEGMVITLEPGLYYREWGARIEDDYLITGEGFEKLSGKRGG
jgi:Xaa-Pro aminopeptidase